jgi:hypothetical protein
MNMSIFVEVNSVEKGCPVIINLDQVVEIAPLSQGGCILFFSDGAGMNSKTSMKVGDSYNSFKQFAMQTVTPEDIQARIDRISQNNPLVKVSVVDAEPEKRGRGRPPKSATITSSAIADPHAE